jgi:hypothetical protein
MALARDGDDGATGAAVSLYSGDGRASGDAQRGIDGHDENDLLIIATVKTMDAHRVALAAGCGVARFRLRVTLSSGTLAGAAYRETTHD